MSDRKTALRNLSVGSIFHARSPSGASMLCLVIRVDDSAIHARRVHTQDDLQFDRLTGIKQTGTPSRIDCVAPFPPDVHQIFVEMDKKYQTLTALDRNGAGSDPLRYRLTPDESRANRFINVHVAANPI